ncbi:hypothetical protein FRC10_006383 [Ceratobasidium sp. 414]|nr:hypothetical protein FRC10_006383 [Ceratobasidium sp. 414]
MGLAERKVKQRIGADPRNLAWAEDAAKFGHTYLAKHGWNPTMGLGVAGEGRVSHIAVAQKLDQLGIGAGRPDGPDAIAWKQAKEFEGLLERLNAAGAGGEAGENGGVVDEAVEEVEEKVEEVEEEGETKQKGDKAKRKDRKREEKRKAKEAKAALEASGSSTPSTPTETTPVAAPAPRRLAHRARFLAAKRLAGASSTALSEILGVSSTPASTSSPSTPSAPTPAPTPGTLTAIPVLNDDNQITTSSQSVADYFRDRMRARAAQGAGASTSSTPVVVFEEPEIDVPRSGLGSSRRDRVEEGEDTRPNGLGFSSVDRGISLGSKRASPPPNTTPSEDNDNNSGDRESKKERKRKWKEQAVAESAPSTAASDPAAQAETESEPDRKAAKRARKEAKRAARQQKEVEAATD